MSKRTLMLTLPLLPLLLLQGCQEDTPTKTLVGADRDAHGCIPSAGYSWCEQQQQCVRPWELKKTDDQQSVEENFHAQCEQP